MHAHAEQAAVFLLQAYRFGMQVFVSVVTKEIVRSRQYFFGLNVDELRSRWTYAFKDEMQKVECELNHYFSCIKINWQHIHEK